LPVIAKNIADSLIDIKQYTVLYNTYARWYDPQYALEIGLIIEAARFGFLMNKLLAETFQENVLIMDVTGIRTGEVGRFLHSENRMLMGDNKT